MTGRSQVTVPAHRDRECIGDLDLPDDVRAIARTREEDEALTEDGMTLARGDTLLPVPDRDRQDRIEGMFRENEDG